MYDGGVFGQLERAIDDLDIPVDGDALVTVIALRDRLEARITDAVATVDRASLWELDGATSMTAWLADRARMARPHAAATASRARKLAQLAVTRHSWRAGVLSSGQVEAIAANLDAETAELFADHESDMVPTLVDLPARDVAVVMQRWREQATADRDPKPEPPQALHHSRTLGNRWRTDGTLNAETGELLATALRLAETRDGEDEPLRSPARRRADALGDICRFFLDHQQARRGGRHRPHLNVVLDIEHYLAGGGGHTADGTIVDRATIDRLLCDSALHRVLTSGRSTILDYGSATRTVAAPLFNALVVRDQHCRFPGCDRPAQWCDGHHVRFWESDGPTALPNLVLLCSRHHHLLHRARWHAKLLPDGTFEVTDPRGRVRTTRPPSGRPPPPLPLE